MRREKLGENNTAREACFMIPVPMRALLGFVAGALSVLIFHQGMVEALYVLGLASLSAYRITPVLPFNVPLIVSLSFWGGVYGMLFAALRPRLPASPWLAGLALGLLAALIGMFVVAPLKGNAMAHAGEAWPIARSLLVNGVWGIGVSILLPVLQPRPLRHGRFAASRAHHAT
jgi:hypothetical protein